MLLSETSNAKDWLRQFNTDDRELARHLLASLRLVSHEEFLESIKNELRNYCEQIDDGPIALYAVRKMKPTETYFQKEGVKPPVAHQSGKIGSEGSIEHVIKQVSRPFRNRFLNHPSVDELRKERCHHIVLIDDISGSGGYASSHVSAMRKDSTIRSWCSYGYIKFHLMAFAISIEAKNRFLRAGGPRRRRHSNPSAVCHGIYTFPTGDEVWTPTQSKKIRDLCKRYGQKAGVSHNMLCGYEDQMGLMVFQHGCPNNSPAVLWKSTSKWNALFPNRDIPESLSECFRSEDSRVSARNRFCLLGASTNIIPNICDIESPSALGILLVLAGARRWKRNAWQLSQVTGLKTEQCEEIVQLCIKHELLDSKGFLTARGRSELAYAEKHHKSPLEPPPYSEKHYYPDSLREPKRTV